MYSRPSLLTGFTVWYHAKLLGVSLDAGMTDLGSVSENHRGLLTVACYHFTAYATATIGGVVLSQCVGVVRRAVSGTKENRDVW